MNNHQSLVRDFHAKFGLTINDTPTLSPQDDALRVALIREEMDELKAGIAKNDRVEIADALADLAYVIYGAGVTYGVELEVIIPTPANTESLEFFLGRFEKYASQGKLPTMRLLLETLLEDVHWIAQDRSISLDACFEEVHRSNMSKLWTDSEISVLVERPNEDMSTTLLFVYKGHEGHRYKGEKGERCWLVKSKKGEKKGKVLKSPSYSPADIAGVLARHEKQAA